MGRDMNSAATFATLAQLRQDPDALMTVVQVAEALGVSVPTLRRRLADHTLRCFFRIGNVWRCRAGALLDWVAEQEGATGNIFGGATR